ncbi:MAG TPA: 50S ribosomal protein L17 [Candidatus Baltobacteraceae bacterium]|nr:50S ribosomal protein L17 [Candidatus Baltobacteraceae bacterium]
MKRLSRTDAHRRATFRSLATSFFKHERIETTSTKAKEMQSIVERLIATARQGTLHARREVAAYLLEPLVTKKLVDQIAPTFKDRSGGFTRILKVRNRRGDGAEVSIIELVKVADTGKA